MAEPPSVLTGERYTKAHHYFVYDRDKVDTKQVRDEAQWKLVDKRSPEDSVIHFHPYQANEECPPNTHHEYYVLPTFDKED
jgi:hypothetical protein